MSRVSAGGCQLNCQMDLVLLLKNCPTRFNLLQEPVLWSKGKKETYTLAGGLAAFAEGLMNALCQQKSTNLHFGTMLPHSNLPF